METQATTQTPAIIERVYVTLEDGRQVEALTKERVQSMIAGMEKKGRLIRADQDGELYDGIKVIGDGNFVESKIGPRFIYNTDLLSQVAYSGNKLQEASDELNDAIDSGDGSLLAVHNACRKFLNALTVSFSVKTAAYNNGELIQAQIDLVTTERGSLITLKNIAHQRAKKLKPQAGATFNLSAMLDARKATRATELKEEPVTAGPAPTSAQQTKADKVTAAANAQS